MGLNVTQHAIERFNQRWRPHLTQEEAGQELALLALVAVRTRRKTLARDATVWLAQAQDGCCVGLAVRDETIVTVLAPGTERIELPDYGADLELYEESQAAMARTRAMVAKEEAEKEKKTKQQEKAAKQKGSTQKSRIDCAREILENLGKGIRYREGAIRRAHEALGLPYTPSNPESLQASALHTLECWRKGQNITLKAVKRAHAVLGLPFKEQKKR